MYSFHIQKIKHYSFSIYNLFTRLSLVCPMKMQLEILRKTSDDMVQPGLVMRKNLTTATTLKLHKYSMAIKVTLAIGEKTLNRCYDRTDTIQRSSDLQVLAGWQGQVLILSLSFINSCTQDWLARLSLSYLS